MRRRGVTEDYGSVSSDSETERHIGGGNDAAQHDDQQHQQHRDHYFQFHNTRDVDATRRNSSRWVGANGRESPSQHRVSGTPGTSLQAHTIEIADRSERIDALRRQSEALRKVHESLVAKSSHTASALASRSASAAAGDTEQRHRAASPSSAMGEADRKDGRPQRWDTTRASTPTQGRSVSAPREASRHAADGGWAWDPHRTRHEGNEGRRRGPLSSPPRDDDVPPPPTLQAWPRDSREHVVEDRAAETQRRKASNDRGPSSIRVPNLSPKKPSRGGTGDPLNGHSSPTKSAMDHRAHPDRPRYRSDDEGSSGVSARGPPRRGGRDQPHHQHHQQHEDDSRCYEDPQRRREQRPFQSVDSEVDRITTERPPQRHRESEHLLRYDASLSPRGRPDNAPPARLHDEPDSHRERRTSPTDYAQPRSASRQRRTPSPLEHHYGGQGHQLRHRTPSPMMPAPTDGDDAAALVEQYQQDVRLLRAQLREMQHRCSILEAENDNVRFDNDSVQNENTGLRKRLDLHERKLTSLAEENDDLRAQLEAAKARSVATTTTAASTAALQKEFDAKVAALAEQKDKYKHKYVQLKDVYRRYVAEVQQQASPGTAGQSMSVSPVPVDPTRGTSAARNDRTTATTPTPPHGRQAQPQAVREPRTVSPPQRGGTAKAVGVPQNLQIPLGKRIPR